MVFPYTVAAAFLLQSPNRLVTLAFPDVLIIAIYFVMVLGIGVYLRRYANTSNDFFMAGREMTAWVAGLSFLSANLGAIELMGWAASTYQYGILAAHFYWIAAFPSMVFLGLVMMPFYYLSKTHSVPGYLQLRYGESARALSGISFAFMTILMSGINMYAMAIVMKVVLGWNIHFSIWVSSLTVAVYVALGGLYSAIFNEVLQFFLIWLGALIIPILGMIEVGGWGGLKARIFQQVHSNDYVHLWSTLGTFSGNPMGVHWTGIVFGLGGAIACGYWTTDFLVVQRAMAAKDLRSAQLAPIIASYFKMVVPLIVILPGLLGLAVLPYHLVPESAMQPGLHSYNEVLPLMLARYAGPGSARPRHYRADRRLHVGHGRQRQRLRHRVDLRHLPALYQKGNVRRALRPHRPLVHSHRRLSPIGTAYFVTNFKSIMDYMQALVGFFISPLFGTVLIGMIWKRATPKGGFWGLLAGTGSSVAMYIAVKIHPSWIRYVALSPDAKDMAENVYRALWSLLICVFVTVVVSLFTKPKTEEQLSGLTWGATMFPKNEHLPFWKTPLFWAGGVAIFFGILQWMFW